MKQDDIYAVYQNILNGTLKRFPPETWNPYMSGYDNSQRAFRYLVYEILKWDREIFVKNINREIIKKYKLTGALGGLYDKVIYNFAKATFPDWDIKAWELILSYVPKGFWTPDTTREAIIWMIEEKLQWDYNEVLNNISTAVFIQYNLHGMLKACFENSIYLAIKHAFPNQDWEYVKERKGKVITFSIAEEIRECANNSHKKQSEIAKDFGVSPGLISMIVNDKIRNKI